MSPFAGYVRRLWWGASPAFLVLALAACGGPDAPEKPLVEDPSDTGPIETGPVDAAPEVPDLTEPVFRTAAECGRCHVEIYREWKASYHGRAMQDPLFREFSADVNQEECIRCHAPVNLRDAGFDTPIARSERREDAVSCLSCHQVEGQVAGTHKGLAGPCRPVYDPDQGDVVKMCFGCHNQHDTGNEWLRGPYSPEAPLPRQRDQMDCLDCHMPPVERPLVKGGPVRTGRRHTWFGGHSLAQLEKAAKLDVVVDPPAEGKRRIHVFTTNIGAGHSIPTDARHRSFDVYVKIWDAKGNVVLDPTNPQMQGRAHLAKFRKFYRGSGKKDTQIPPLVRTATLGDGPGYVEVPGSLVGRGEAWLVYRLTPRDVLNKGSLTPASRDDVGRLWRARVVLRKEFSIGP